MLNTSTAQAPTPAPLMATRLGANRMGANSTVVLPLGANALKPNVAAGAGALNWFPQEDLTRAFLEHMLNEVDYGMLVVGANDRLLHMNLAATQQLDGEHALQLAGGQVRARNPQEAGIFASALEAAERGLRRLITMGEGEQRVSVAVVPLAKAAGGAAATLLMLGRRRVCQQLSVQGFAMALAITPAETRVLEALCAGTKPTEIARQNKVKMSTVRAQIHSIRSKCGAGSIRELVQQVSMLPPMLSALRSNAPTANSLWQGLIGAPRSKTSWMLAV